MTKIAVKRSKRPVMELLELIGQRWTLRILWELRDGPQTFRSLQERCGGLSPSLVNRRLRALRDGGIVDHHSDGYALSGIGAELAAKLLDLTEWSERWAKNRNAAKAKRPVRRSSQ